jgi:hypothetical protein
VVTDGLVWFFPEPTGVATLRGVGFFVIDLGMLDAPIEEWIGGQNVHEKQYTEVEYIAVKTKYFIISYNLGFCLADV